MEAGLRAMTPGRMDMPAEFFGLKTTRRGAYVLVLTHVHEHLGQVIAYARANKITPPWSARDGVLPSARRPLPIHRGARALESRPSGLSAPRVAPRIRR